MQQSPSNHNHSTPKLALICFIFFFLVYLLTARGNIRISDEIAVFGAGISLAERGDFAVNQLMPLDEEVNIGIIGRNGNLYAKYPPGNMLLTAGLYSLFKNENGQPFIWNADVLDEPITLAASVSASHVTLFINTLLGAIGIMALFLILHKSYELKTAILTTLLIGLTTDWWYQSRGYLSELGAGTLMMVSLYAAHRSKPYASAAWLGVSMLFRPTNIVGFPIWMLSFWDKDFIHYLKNLRKYSFKEHLQIAGKTYLSGLMIALFGILFAFYNWWRYENLLEIGYSGEGFTNPLIKGILGVLFSPAASIFLFSPILILSISGIKMLYHQWKGLTLAAGLTSLFYILLIAKWNSWEGGFAWGERLVTPIIPLFGIFVAPVIDRAWKNKSDFLLIGFFALAGLAIQFSTIAKDPFWVMLDALDNGILTWDEAYHTLSKSWIGIQFRGLENWNFCHIDAWLLRIIFNCGG